ncbi:hypothetical protein H6P81_019670 [Aristolochia fimbriata]|uniref:Peroxisomal ATPase PEX6 n=1 Tax=Aristolochia fimbriata TaxID=158543 RepID=A0AAV7DSA1_ARIFI|nr:hypothetical protein H6P81_019670 [Aristolochia fimbriata]
MVQRRTKSRILFSSESLVDSVFKQSVSCPEGGTEAAGKLNHQNSSSVRLRAGLLRCEKDGGVTGGFKDSVFDDSALVGVSVRVLKRLSLTSGSLVLVKNVETKVGRIGRVVRLESPRLVHDNSKSQFNASSTQYHRVMAALPSCIFPPSDNMFFYQEVAYLSPQLLFNIGLQISCLKAIVQGGQESLDYLLDMEKHVEGKNGVHDFEVHIELLPWPGLPMYASHLRASFIKIPECGTLESLKGSSTAEAEDRQEFIDLALHEYFGVDRFFARGDHFCIQINWKCNSPLCVSCYKKTLGDFRDIKIHFKVVAMEPTNEPFLRVNRNETAVVLGGSVTSSVPPISLLAGLKSLLPLHYDVVKALASILTPSLCPSVLSSKFRTAVLLFGLAGCGKRTVVKYVASCLGLHVVEYSCHDLVSSSEKKASVALYHAFNTASRYSPAILLLRHFDAFGSLPSNDGSPLDQVGATSEVASVIRECTEALSDDEDCYTKEETDGSGYIVESPWETRHPVLLVAAADSSEGLPSSIRRCFSHEINVAPLSEAQRLEMLSQLLQCISNDSSIKDEEVVLKNIVGQTSGFMPRDIRGVVADAGAIFVPKLHEKIGFSGSWDFAESNSGKPKPSPEDSALSLGKENLAKALERSKKRNASALGTPKVPNVKWEDVGGLEEVKKAILDTVQLPLLHKDLFSSGLRKRSGVLLYGPPGTGKTLLAKAVATECSLNFLSVKGPELINMYIGESEKNVRDIFQKARSARPCVIFFDELDSLAPARGASGDSGGVMDRVVSQMLAEIDGLNDSSQDLFIIGASNRPDLIDPALLRPGRFDKLLYVGVNSDASYRERVLSALTRKFKLHENVSLFSIAKRCPPNFTGADMYALCADAWFHAAKRKVSSLPANVDEGPDSVVVELDDFMKVLGELSPSLSMAELNKYEKLHQQFEGASR